MLFNHFKRTRLPLLCSAERLHLHWRLHGDLCALHTNREGRFCARKQWVCLNACDAYRKGTRWGIVIYHKWTSKWRANRLKLLVLVADWRAYHKTKKQFYYTGRKGEYINHSELGSTHEHKKIRWKANCDDDDEEHLMGWISNGKKINLLGEGSILKPKGMYTCRQQKLYQISLIGAKTCKVLRWSKA